MKRRKIVRQMNNAGSTMVEVIVGFVILVMVLAECMVHLLGVSGELVKKSKDMQEEQRILNEEMYRTDTVFETLADTGITLAGGRFTEYATGNELCDRSKAAPLL